MHVAQHPKVCASLASCSQKMSDFVFVTVPPQSSVEVLLGAAAHPSGSASVDPLTPGMEFTALLSRRSFLEDILKKSFGNNTSAQRGDPDDDSFVVVASVNGTTASPSSELATVTVDINAGQWARTLRQFTLDINRQVFTVRGQRLMDATVAMDAVSNFLREMLTQGGANNPYLQRFQQQMELLPESKGRAPCEPRRDVGFDDKFTYVGDEDSHAALPWSWFSFSSATRYCGSSMWSEAEEYRSSTLIDRVVRGLTREVLLVSQQSVMGFPLELLTQCVSKAAGRSEWYVGEVRSNRSVGAAAGGNNDKDKSSTMRIEIDEGVATYLNHRPKCHNSSGGEGTPERGGGGLFSGIMGMFASPLSTPAPPAPSAALRAAPANAASPPSKVPTLRITKLLRVFAIDMDVGRDVTQFHIFASLEISLFGGEDDPIQLTWWVVDDSNGGESNERHEVAAVPPIAVSNVIRICQCLGASAGFHRSDCSSLGPTAAAAASGGD